MKIGIIGVGVIGSAIVEGLCYGHDESHQVFLSPRNHEIGNKLVDLYANVKQCSSNQEVLDQAELVIISVLPEIGLDLLTDLEFNESHHVINLMRNIKLEEIETLIGPTKSLTHMVPLSFISKRKGPIAVFPGHKVVIDIFNHLGQVMIYECMDKIEAVAAITGLMTSYYRLLHDVSLWGKEKALTDDEAKDYTCEFFKALTQHAQESDLEKLAGEATPGGINEFALRRLEKDKVFTRFVETLNPMLNDVKNQ